MENIISVLNKYHKDYLHKNKSSKKIIKNYERDFKNQGLYFKINDDFDFIDFLVIVQSFNNMNLIIEKFFDIKAELIEIWDVVEFSEKKNIVSQMIDPFLDTLKAFYVDDKRYFISYFDFLINAYYDHDILMFEKDAYRKYLYNFDSIVDLENKYDYIPLKSGFTPLELIYEDENTFVMYDKLTSRLYFYTNNRFSIGLAKNISINELKEITKYILDDNNIELIDYLIENKLVNKKAIKSLEKIKGKLV